MALFSEIEIRLSRNEIVIRNGQPIIEVIVLSSLVAVIFILIYKLPFWILLLVLLFDLLAIGNRHVLVIKTDENKIVKENRFGGIIIGQPKVFDFSQDELYFDTAFMTDVSRGKVFYYRLCLINQDEQLLYLEDYKTAKKLEDVLLKAGVINSSSLPNQHP